MEAAIVEGKGAVLGVYLGPPIKSNGGLCDALFSNYFEDLLLFEAGNR